MQLASLLFPQSICRDRGSAGPGAATPSRGRLAQRLARGCWLRGLPEPKATASRPRMSRPRDATTARLAATHGRIDPLPLGPHPGAFRSLGRPTTLRSLSIGSQRPVAPSLRGRSLRRLRSGGVRSGQQGNVSVGDAGVGVGVGARFAAPRGRCRLDQQPQRLGGREAMIELGKSLAKAGPIGPCSCTTTP